MKMRLILGIVTYGYGAFAVLFTAMFCSMRFLFSNRFVGWLLFEYNPNPPIWIGITGTATFILVVYGIISAIFFMTETARIINRKIGEKKGERVRIVL